MTKTTIYAPAGARLGAALILSTALAACGGGAGGDGGRVPNLSGSVTITGTAATVIAGSASNAIGGAEVLATCARGAASTMTNADGSFSVTVANPGAAPCVLQLFRADNSSLRSIATGPGNFNITPVTELLVAYISTQVTTPAVPVTPGTVNSAVTLSTNAAFAKLASTPALLSNSIARVGEIVKTFPAPATPGLVVPSDWLTGQLVAKTPSNPGNAQNAFLEALRARNTITATGTVNGNATSEAARDAALPVNKVAAP